MVLIPEKVIPEQRTCDKHKNQSACKGEVLPRVFTTGDEDTERFAVDLCQKAFDEACLAISVAITPRTRKQKKGTD